MIGCGQEEEGGGQDAPVVGFVQPWAANLKNTPSK